MDKQLVIICQCYEDVKTPFTLTTWCRQAKILQTVAVREQKLVEKYRAMRRPMFRGDTNIWMTTEDIILWAGKFLILGSNT